MTESKSADRDFRVAIVGGGPGGLFSAWHLAAKAGNGAKITIFEASERLGGKIVTKEFAGAGLYEAGVAEIYDYSHLGPDPLRDLIQKDLNLEVVPFQGGPCVLDGTVIASVDSLADHYGEEARDAAVAFRTMCKDSMSMDAFYRSSREFDNSHPWAKLTGEQVLTDYIPNDAARRYIRAMSHSDVAAAPQLTSGLNFLKNVLMDVDGYINIYSVVGGNEEIVRRLADELDAEVKLNARVQSVLPLPNGSVRLEIRNNGAVELAEFDYVIFALPLTALSIINWRSELLQKQIMKHIGYFDRPAHYLRVTLLFERPFWREHISSGWWMMDAFDGCCVYDEGARHSLGGWGALSFLIAGNAALGLANFSDERIEELCLDALPPELEFGRDLLVDRRVHRWMASVNAVPGGLPVRDRLVNHRPDPANLPGVFIVGDYMFDATLNGVLDSADTATDIILGEILVQRRAARQQQELEPIIAEVEPIGAGAERCNRYFEAEFLRDLLRIVWKLPQDAKILHVGSGSGELVDSLRSIGFNVFGIEANRFAHERTPSSINKFNYLFDLAEFPFQERQFDVVIETGLCYLSQGEITNAVAALKQVSPRLILGSVTTDLTIELIERYDLLDGVKTLASRWDWSECLSSVGFEHALSDPSVLADAWKRAEEAGAGLGHWYEDAESLLYCFYEAPRADTRSGLIENVGTTGIDNDCVDLASRRILAN